MDIDVFINDIYDKEGNFIKGFSSIECLCSNCKENRKMFVKMWQYFKPHDLKFSTSRLIENDYNILKESISKDEVIESIFPSLWVASCKQCEKDHYIVLYKSDNFRKGTILSQGLSGIYTNRTPEGVKYYLDQAHKCKTIGANSACIAMYRAALEQVLYGEGYKQNLLAKKINQLEEDIENNKGKKWTKTINPKLLEYIKDLGNGAVHPNNGDINKQTVFDDNLVKSIEILFCEFLKEIYEKQFEKDSIELMLEKAVKDLKSK